MKGMLKFLARRLARRVLYKLLPTGRATSAFRLIRGAVRLAAHPLTDPPKR
jgi:hypothetical protein